MKDAYLYIVEKAVAIEFDSPEYGRLARKIVEMLLERGEDLTDDRVAILLNKTNTVLIGDKVRVSEIGVEGVGPVAERAKRLFEEFLKSRGVD